MSLRFAEVLHDSQSETGSLTFWLQLFKVCVVGLHKPVFLLALVFRLALVFYALRDLDGLVPVVRVLRRLLGRGRVAHVFHRRVQLAGARLHHYASDLADAAVVVFFFLLHRWLIYSGVQVRYLQGEQRK